MAETAGQILDRVIATYNEELCAIGNEVHIPNRYGMEYCAVIAARYATALNADVQAAFDDGFRKGKREAERNTGEG